MGAWENFKSKLKTFAEQANANIDGAGSRIEIRGSSGVVISDSGNIHGASGEARTAINVQGSEGVEIIGSGNIGLPPEAINQAVDAARPLASSASERGTGEVSVTAQSDGKTVTATGNRIINSANLTGTTGQTQIDAPGADIQNSGTVTPPPGSGKSGGGRGR